MKKQWSNDWVSSAQPRKQRKYRHNAPLHVMRKFLSVNLSPGLRERVGKRSAVVRKGDQVKIVRGDLKGKSGPVERVSLRKGKVYIEGIKAKKVDGSEVSLPLSPSNLQIMNLKLEDKKRQATFERSGRTGAAKAAAQKPKKKEKGE